MFFCVKNFFFLKIKELVFKMRSRQYGGNAWSALDNKGVALKVLRKADKQSRESKGTSILFQCLSEMPAFGLGRNHIRAF